MTPAYKEHLKDRQMEFWSVSNDPT